MQLAREPIPDAQVPEGRHMAISGDMYNRFKTSAGTEFGTLFSRSKPGHFEFIFSDESEDAAGEYGIGVTG